MGYVLLAINAFAQLPSRLRPLLDSAETMLKNKRKTVRRLNNLPGCFIFIPFACADISRRPADALTPLDKHFDERAGVIIHVPLFFSNTQDINHIWFQFFRLECMSALTCNLDEGIVPRLKREGGASIAVE